MTPRTRLASTLITLSALFAHTGCNDGSEGDAGLDGGQSVSCDGLDDGTPCGSGLLCVGGECVTSGCGDGFVDEAAGEECDDRNDIAFDGCEPEVCRFTCVQDAQCNDDRPCNGIESCVDHVCVMGSPPGNGAECELESGGAGVCRGDTCVTAGCGNGVIDGEEECDDANETDRDGCDVDCTFSCRTEGTEECSDGDVCNGEETCDVETHACVAGEPLDCTDGDECTADECDPIAGCIFPLIDADGDGHAPDSLACGTDCDDGDPDRFEGAEELCDGKDNDCNGIMDDGAPIWYVDCDGDGFAADTTGATVEPSCDPPSLPPAGCGGGGGWTSVRPTGAANTDCNDDHPDVYPGQTAWFGTAIPGAPADRDYDYDCDGNETRRYGCSLLPCSGPSCLGAGYIEGCTTDCSSGRYCVVGIPPQCGATYPYRTCRPVAAQICHAGMGPRQQTCH